MSRTLKPQRSVREKPNTDLRYGGSFGQSQKGFCKGENRSTPSVNEKIFGLCEEKTTLFVRGGKTLEQKVERWKTVIIVTLDHLR